MASVEGSSIESLTVGKNNHYQEDSSGIRQDTVLEDIWKPQIDISSQDNIQTESNLSSQIGLSIQSQQKSEKIQGDTVSEVSSSILYDDPKLPSGWRRLIKKRQGGNSAGRYDVLITNPEGKKFRSARKIKEYLEKNPQLPFKSEDFNFSLTKDRNGYKTRLGSQACETPTHIRRKVKRVKSKNISEDEFPKGQILSNPPIPSIEVTPACHIIVNPCYTQIQQVILPPIPEGSPQAQLILQNYKQSLTNFALNPIIFETPIINPEMLPKFVLKSSTNQPKYPQESHKNLSVQSKDPKESDKIRSEGHLIRNGNKLVRIKPKVPQSAIHPGRIIKHNQSTNKKPQEISIHRQNEVNETNDDSIDYEVPELRICEDYDLELPVNKKDISSPPSQKKRKIMANTVLTSSTPRPQMISNLLSKNNAYQTIFQLQVPLPNQNVESKEVTGLTQLSSRAPTTLISTMTPSRMSSTVQMPLNMIQMTNKSDEIKMDQNNDVIVINPGDSTLSHEDIIEEENTNEVSTEPMPDHSKGMEDCNVKNKSKTKIIRRITKSFDIRAFARSKGRQVIFGTSDPKKLPFLANASSEKLNASLCLSKPSYLENDSQNEVKNSENMNNNTQECDFKSEQLDIKREYLEQKNDNLDPNIKQLNFYNIQSDYRDKNIESNEVQDNSHNNSKKQLENKNDHLDTNLDYVHNERETVSNNNPSKEVQNIELDDVKNNSLKTPAITSQQLRDMLFSDSDSDSDSD